MDKNGKKYAKMVQFGSEIALNDLKLHCFEKIVQKWLISVGNDKKKTLQVQMS